MRKIVILEGPDGAGKTTLAKTMFGKYEYIHFGPPPTYKHGAWFQYLQLLKDLWENPNGPDVVIDRFIHGELVYGRILRGQTDMEWAHIRMMERVLLGMDARLIVCLPPWQTVLANWEGNLADELLSQPADLRTVYNFYTSLLDLSDLDRAKFDYHDPGPDYPNKYVVRSDNQGPGIGAFVPEQAILMVGDIVNYRAGYEAWPFVATTGCSPWLAQLLMDGGISENLLYWINSRTTAGPTDASFVAKLKPRKIIALGNKAQDWCDANDLVSEKVMHPQAWKRFQSAEPYPLIEALTSW